jgi:AraC-like DNA-binding protein
MHVGPAVKVLPITLESSYLVHIPVHGKTEFDIGGKTFIAESERAAVMSPGLRLTSHWHRGCSALLISIDRPLLEFHLESFLGAVPRSPVVFEPILDMNSGGGQTWKQLWNYLLMELNMQRFDPGSAKWGRDAVALIIDALLLNAHHTCSEVLIDYNRRNLPHYLRRAENFMYAHAGDPMRLEQVASHAGVSLRTLRKAFVKYRGVPPVRALLHLRLDAVNRDLSQSNGIGSVTEFASRWGFRELGRFAVKYRKRFNETPSQTLRRQRKSS